MTGQLTRALIDLLDQSQDYGKQRLAETLNFVCSAMIGHRGNTGVNPYSGLNVERMFSALRLLQTRSDHEASPFVTSWLPSVEAFDDHPIPTTAKSVSSEIARAMMDGGGGDVHAAIAEVARAAMQPGSGDMYGRLERELKSSVCGLLASHEDVTYLTPLVELAAEQNGLDVATLNYDLTVEAMCRLQEFEVDTGIVGWEPGRPLAFRGTNTPKLNLLKLHGSIDWAYEHRSPGGEDKTRFISTSVVTTIDPAQNRVPAIVIGDREKLTANGPTLALIRGFEEALERAHRLVVVGYSFGDDHVNAIIRNWVNTNESRTLTVLDPYWPRDPNGFQKDLIDGLVRSSFRGPVGDPRMKVIRSSAKERLSDALRRGPEPELEPQLEAKFLRDGNNTPLIRLINFGEDIERLTIRTERFQPEGHAEIFRGFAEPNSGADTLSSQCLGDVTQGSYVDVEPRFMDESQLGRTAISLQYRTSVGDKHVRLDVEVTADPAI
jgi:hypothetical protein